MNKSQHLKPILAADRLTLEYRNGHPVVRDLSLAVEPGEIVALVGPNGSGKSTLLRAMARLMRPQRGTVTLNGQAIHRMNPRKVAQQLAILPQNPAAPEDLTVRDLVARGRFSRQAWWRPAGTRDRDAIGWALEMTGLDDFAARRLSTLSGGERQRAWIALALAQEPRVLLLDEPTTFLDISHQLDVMTLLQRLNRESELSIVMVLHDLNQAARFSHRLVAIHTGQVYAAGAPVDVLTEQMMREVFQVEGTIGRDPFAGTPVFTPLQSVRGRNGSSGRPDAALAGGPPVGELAQLHHSK